MWDFFTGICSTISSTEPNLQPDFTLKIHPNPFSNQIKIESENAMGQNISIYNLQGIRQFSGKINSNSYTIDLNTLSPNLYILNVGGAIRKLVKID